MLFSTLAENCAQFIRNGGGEVSERARAKWVPLGTNATAGRLYRNGDGPDLVF